jgi:hypothetical protein
MGHSPEWGIRRTLSMTGSRGPQSRGEFGARLGLRFPSPETGPAVSGALSPHKSHAPDALRVSGFVPFRREARHSRQRTRKLPEVSH